MGDEHSRGILVERCILRGASFMSDGLTARPQEPLRVTETSQEALCATRRRRIIMMMIMMMTFKRSTLLEQVKKCLQEAKVTVMNVKDIHNNSNFELITAVVIRYVKHCLLTILARTKQTILMNVI